MEYEEYIFTGGNIKKYFKDIEWSAGNGQCPICFGVPESWLGHPIHLTSKNLGHKKDCRLAKAMKESGLHTIFIGESLLTEEYECFIDENGFFGTRIKTKDGCPKIKQMNKDLSERFDKIIFESILELVERNKQGVDNGEDERVVVE